MTEAGASDSGQLALRRLTARSVVLSVLLSLHPPALAVRDLVRAVEIFDISESALRVALTRMVAAGDLERADHTYRLSHRLLDRQRRQDEAIAPKLLPWQGDWDIAVITVSGRSAADRAALRADLDLQRLGEVREGVWMRPANLSQEWPPHLGGQIRRFTGRPDADPQGLARELWDLDGWARAADELLALFDEASRRVDRFTVTAAGIRHLLRDPALPTELLPSTWPGPALRAACAAYEAEFLALRATAVRPGATGSTPRASTAAE